MLYEVYRVINNRLVGRMHIFGNYGLIVTDLRTTGCAMYKIVPPPHLHRYILWVDDPRLTSCRRWSFLTTKIHINTLTEDPYQFKSSKKINSCQFLPAKHLWRAGTQQQTGTCTIQTSNRQAKGNHLRSPSQMKKLYSFSHNHILNLTCILTDR